MLGYPEVVGEPSNGAVQGLQPGQQVVQPTVIARTLYAASPAASINAGTSSEFAVTVQVPMRLDQLIVVDETDGVASNLRITRIAVGPNNQIVSNGGVLPARMFAPESFNTNMLQGNTARPGVDILVTVFNPAASAAKTCVVSVKGVALTGA